MGELMRPIGDLDLHLFGEGTHRRLWELLGPRPLHVSNDGDIVGARFTTWSPDADAVFVVGDWNQWTSEPMTPVGVSGIWSTLVSAARTSHCYAFDVSANGRDLERVPDSMARQAEPGTNGRSVVAGSGRHEWTDDEWMHARATAADAPRNVHRLDLAALQRGGTTTWEGVASHVLGVVGSGGISHVEVSPTSTPAFATSSPTMGLVPGLFAPTASLGEPDGFRRFVDGLHRHDVGVVVEWPPSAALGASELHRNELRNQVMANALYWLEEFHADGLRIGAGFADTSAEMASAVGETIEVVREEFPDAVMIVD